MENTQVLEEAQAYYSAYKDLEADRKAILKEKRLRGAAATIASALGVSSGKEFTIRYGWYPCIKYIVAGIDNDGFVKEAGIHKDEHLDVYIEAARAEMDEYLEQKALSALPAEGQLELPL